MQKPTPAKRQRKFASALVAWSATLDSRRRISCGMCSGRVKVDVYAPFSNRSARVQVAPTVLQPAATATTTVMPLTKWFHSHRRSSTTSTTGDEAARLSATETLITKHKTKRTKHVTQRARRSHSHGSGLRAMIGLGGSKQRELDTAAEIAAIEEEEQRRISYQTKTRRRSTIHGLSYQHKHSDAEWSCDSTPTGSPSSTYASSSPGYSRSQSHRRTSRMQQVIPLTPDSHPSIIFIDCPP